MQIRFFTLLLSTAIIIGCGSLKKELTIEVSNPISIDRENEIVEVDWKEIQQKLSVTGNQTVIVTDGDGQQIPYQLVTNGSETAEILIFPVSVGAGQAATYRVATGNPEPFTPLVYGRLVPERKDDFTWENNRTAFRVYGPALKATGEISNGMDFWAKKTESLIIDKWYANDLSGAASYHADHGEGLDFYTVGRTLGLGMTAPFLHDTLWLGDNFITAQILDNGPLRITFRLTYDPYDAGERKITETRVISLDAYTLFNKVTNLFETDAPELTVATGIVMQKEKAGGNSGQKAGEKSEQVAGKTHGISDFPPNTGIIAYETPGDGVNGVVYTAALHPNGFETIKVSNGHYLGLNSYRPGTPYTYYAGGGWSKAGFGSFEEWTQFVKEAKEKIDQPLIIQIK